MYIGNQELYRTGRPRVVPEWERNAPGPQPYGRLLPLSGGGWYTRAQRRTPNLVAIEAASAESRRAFPARQQLMAETFLGAVGHLAKVHDARAARPWPLFNYALLDLLQPNKGGAVPYARAFGTVDDFGKWFWGRVKARARDVQRSPGWHDDLPVPPLYDTHEGPHTGTEPGQWRECPRCAAADSLAPDLLRHVFRSPLTLAGLERRRSSKVSGAKGTCFAPRTAQEADPGPSLRMRLLGTAAPLGTAPPPTGDATVEQLRAVSKFLDERDDRVLEGWTTKVRSITCGPAYVPHDDDLPLPRQIHRRATTLADQYPGVFDAPVALGDTGTYGPALARDLEAEIEVWREACRVTAARAGEAWTAYEAAGGDAAVTWSPRGVQARKRIDREAAVYKYQHADSRLIVRYNVPDGPIDLHDAFVDAWTDRMNPRFELSRLLYEYRWNVSVRVPRGDADDARKATARLRSTSEDRERRFRRAWLAYNGRCLRRDVEGEMPKFLVDLEAL